MNALFTYRISFVAIFALIFLSACSSGNKEQQKEDTKKKYSEMLQKFSRNEDSLRKILHKQIESKNDIGIMISYKFLGKHLRESAKFSNAIEAHQSYLNAALKLKDTLEIIQAFNDLGTDFRRVGALSEATNYHYEALRYADAFSDVQNSGRKPRVMALNGIGNISMQLGYDADAEKYFRQALKEEIALGSEVGQAINYANLGSIFKNRQEYDSARVYYRHSLEKNIQAKSTLGIGLCYIHLGNLYKIEKKYDLAQDEYQKAYDLMEHFSDRWHWLNACIALATIHLEGGNLQAFEEYIRQAEETAKKIDSPRHVAEIYQLKHNYAIKRNDFRQALEHYKHSIAMRDSVQGIKNTNHYMDSRVNYEREQNLRRLKQIEAEKEIKEIERQRILKVTWGVLLAGVVLSGLLYYAYYQRTRSNLVLERMEQARTDFFTNLTHEFRTPLTVIQGLNRQLQHRKNLSEKEKTKFREAIDRQSENLLKLVNQLLDIAKLQGGTDKPEWKRDDIVSYLRMTAEIFRLYAAEKNVSLVFYTDVAAQEMDFVPFYMDKIISNLLSNAIKHTDSGDKIDFIVVASKKTESIVIRIADNGEGIHKEELIHIFDLFYQSPNAKNTSGTGIGLAFTKMLVERMRGKIEVESEFGKGSVFTVTLPLRNKDIFVLPKEQSEVVMPTIEIDNESLVEAPEENQVFTHSERPVVLVVEDNKDVTLYVKSLLEPDYNVITAKDGNEGIEKAEQYMPDLVITDVMMPIKNGYEFCKEMKKSMLLNHIPIVMLTAKISEEDRIEGLKYGVEAYIKKPFRSEELGIRIENILENRKILKEKYLKAIETSSSGSHLHSDENLKFLQKVINIIHSDLNNPNFNATFLADKMAMSTSQLSRKLNQITGFSTASYILQVKLSKAKTMLRDASISLGEVADVCGFYDLSYFSRVFKKEVGITPSQYQKNISIGRK